ncbi:MAG: sugar ABC transporter permease [Planctomycetota bacterium]
MHRKSTWIGVAFVSPWIVGFLLLYAYPFAASFYWSFCRYDLLTPPTVVGGANYARIWDELREGTGFGRALWNTTYYACLAVPLSIVLGILLATVLSWKVRGQAIYRTLCFVPAMIPVVASCILWVWMLDPQDGIVNRGLAATGISSSGPQWFLDDHEAAWLPAWWQGNGGWGSKDALVLMALWGVGNFMLIYLAALQDISGRLYEAAALDGAGRGRQFWHITLPMLTPIILFNLVMGLIQSVQVFTQMYLVSEGTGAPNQSTLVLSLHLFLSAFQDLDMGYASAVAWMLFVVLVAATVALFRSSRYWVHYSTGGSG